MGGGSKSAGGVMAGGLVDGEYVKGMAVIRDARRVLRVNWGKKVVIGRSARGRGAGGDPEKGEQAA